MTTVMKASFLRRIDELKTHRGESSANIILHCVHMHRYLTYTASVTFIM